MEVACEEEFGGNSVQASCRASGYPQQLKIHHGMGGGNCRGGLSHYKYAKEREKKGGFCLRKRK
ncbi:hypothetical protein SESBI_34020 [Sesbania bispinosa]|nr:hypothetical protein SESBI_34020 [Sesbania bispinosa]